MNHNFIFPEGIQQFRYPPVVRQHLSPIILVLNGLAGIFVHMAGAGPLYASAGHIVVISDSAWGE